MLEKAKAQYNNEIAALKQEHATREKTLINEKQRLTEKLDSMQSLIDDANVLSETYETDVSYERERADAAEVKVHNLTAQILSLQNQSTSTSIDVTQVFEHLPKTLTDVLNIMCEIFDEHICVLPEAYASAKNYDVSPYDAWDMLMAVMVNVPYLNKNPFNGSFEEAFKQLCGYEVSLREGKMTRNNPDLSQLRRRTWNGREIDISPHIKHKGRNTDFRIHFYYDIDTDTVVIGHAGSHLDNASTRYKRF